MQTYFPLLKLKMTEEDFFNPFRRQISISWVKNRSSMTINMLLQFVFFEFVPRNRLKRYSPYMPHQNLWNPRYWPPYPPGAYTPVCQNLIISKYNHVTPQLKGNFMLNCNQVVKSRKNHYFDCFNFF